MVSNFDVVVESPLDSKHQTGQVVDLPLKVRSGVISFGDLVFDSSCRNCLRLYPQDNDTDGFFVARIRKLSDKEKLTTDGTDLHGRRRGLG